MGPPRNRWDIAGECLPWMLVAGIPLAASFVPTARIPRIPWLGHSRCLLLKLTGIPCPFCGGTRSFQALSRGEWSAGFDWNPLAAGLYFLAWGVLLAGAVFLVRGRTPEWTLSPPASPAGRFTRILLRIGLPILFLAHWTSLWFRF